MSSLFKNLLIVLLVVVLIAAVYMFTIGKKEDSVTPGAETASTAAIRLQNERILANTQEIKNYKMDVSIFSDTRFKSLRDYQVEIFDVNTGRENPFAPVN